MVDRSRRFRKALTKRNARSCKAQQDSAMSLCRKYGGITLAKLESKYTKRSQWENLIDSAMVSCGAHMKVAANNCYILGGKAHKLRRKGPWREGI